MADLQRWNTLLEQAGVPGPQDQLPTTPGVDLKKWDSLLSTATGYTPSDPPNLKMANDLASQDTGSYNGLCQKFVEQTTYGQTGIEKSAKTAWLDAQNKVNGLNGIKKGDLIYFTPNDSNGYDGHTGIYEGNGKFISATDVGIKSHTLDEWGKLTDQKPLGYIPTR